MTRLEQRYRLVLRLLPAPYREIWEEDMVSTFLASVETDDEEDAEYLADFGRPGWPEVASIMALAVRLRVGGAGAPPRYAAWGNAIRRVVLVGLLVNAAASTVGLVLTLWQAGKIPLISAPEVPAPPGYPALWQRIFLVTALVGLLWLPAFLALVLGRHAAARWLASSAVVASMLSLGIAIAFTPQQMSAELSYDLLTDAVLVLALLAFNRGTALVEHRFWLTGFVLGTVVITAYSLVLFRPMDQLPPLDWAGLQCVILVAAAIVHFALLTTGRAMAWTPALAILAFVVFGLRMVTLLDYARFGSAGWHPATVPLAVAEAVVVGATAIVLALLSARTLRRLPATAADATAWTTSSS